MGTGLHKWQAMITAVQCFAMGLQCLFSSHLDTRDQQIQGFKSMSQIQVICVAKCKTSVKNKD